LLQIDELVLVSECILVSEAILVFVLFSCVSSSRVRHPFSGNTAKAGMDVSHGLMAIMTLFAYRCFLMLQVQVQVTMQLI
jgi:hypothetical protein